MLSSNNSGLSIIFTWLLHYIFWVSYCTLEELETVPDQEKPAEEYDSFNELQRSLRRSTRIKGIRKRARRLEEAWLAGDQRFQGPWQIQSLDRSQSRSPFVLRAPCIFPA
jgi:hypothetical protein